MKSIAEITLPVRPSMDCRPNQTITRKKTKHCQFNRSMDRSVDLINKKSIKQNQNNNYNHQHHNYYQQQQPTIDRLIAFSSGSDQTEENKQSLSSSLQSCNKNCKIPSDSESISIISISMLSISNCSPCLSRETKPNCLIGRECC